MRSARLVAVLLAVPLAIAIAIAFAILLWVLDPVDGCLDQGGAWDYELESCAFDYQPAPPDDRHP